MNVGKWLERFSVDCGLKYPSKSTQKTYWTCVSIFLYRFSKYEHPKEIPTDEIKVWLLEAVTLNTRKHRLCAVNAFYRLTVGMPLKTGNIPYPRSEKKLPRIIDNDFIRTRILAIKNKKHKAILAVGYCCAMRVSEVINLKISDINGKQRLVLIRQAKGNKDRYVGISEKVLNILREYYTNYKPKQFLFEGASGEQYTSSSCNAIYHKYIDDATSFHTLRHASLTSMIEAGTNILAVQTIAGHKNPKTTGIYYHVSPKFLSQVPAPL